MVVKIISNFIDKITGKVKEVKTPMQDTTPANKVAKEVIDPQQEMIKRQELLYKKLNDNLSDADKEKLLSSITNLSTVLKTGGPAAGNKNKSQAQTRT